jgi:hypothetical protein
MECANYYLLVNSTKGIFGCWYSPRARCQKGKRSILPPAAMHAVKCESLSHSQPLPTKSVDKQPPPELNIESL